MRPAAACLSHLGWLAGTLVTQSSEGRYLAPAGCDRCVRGRHAHTIRAGERRRARRGRQAAAAFEGEHDFAQFANLPERDADAVRRVARCALVAGPGPALRIEVTGDGFLWRMVRHMVRAHAAQRSIQPCPNSARTRPERCSGLPESGRWARC